MKFERQKAKPIENVSEKQILRGLTYMEGVSSCRIAVLSHEDGSYVQVGGSGSTCVLEWRNQTINRQFRAFQHPPVVPWEGVTKLNISGGVMMLRQEEFFRITQVRDAFSAFFRHQPFPNYIQWRDVTDEVSPVTRKPTNESQ